eukprot:Selendium_serpulae@DN4643_c0_g1_i2.p1
MSDYEDEVEVEYEPEEDEIEVEYEPEVYEETGDEGDSSDEADHDKQVVDGGDEDDYEDEDEEDEEEADEEEEGDDDITLTGEGYEGSASEHDNYVTGTVKLTSNEGVDDYGRPPSAESEPGEKPSRPSKLVRNLTRQITQRHKRIFVEGGKDSTIDLSRPEVRLTRGKSVIRRGATGKMVIATPDDEEIELAPDAVLDDSQGEAATGGVYFESVAGLDPVPETPEEFEERTWITREPTRVRVQFIDDDYGDEPDYQSSLAEYLQEMCPREMTAVKNIMATMVLPGASVKRVELIFDYHNYRLLFGREENQGVHKRSTEILGNPADGPKKQWRFYPLTHIISWSEDPAVVRKTIDAQVSEAITWGGEQNVQDALDIPLDLDTLCCLEMKGLPAPLVFNFDDTTMKLAFVTVVNHSVEFLQMPGFKADALEEARPFLDRAETLKKERTVRLEKKKTLLKMLTRGITRHGYVGGDKSDSEKENEEIDDRNGLHRSLRRMQTRAKQIDEQSAQDGELENYDMSARRGGLQLGFTLPDLNELIDDASKNEK